MFYESSWKKTAASLPVIHRFTGGDSVTLETF